MRCVVCVTALFAGISCRFNLHTSYLPGNEIQFDLRCSLTELKSRGVKVGAGGGEEMWHHVMHITLSTDYMEGIHGNKKSQTILATRNACSSLTLPPGCARPPGCSLVFIILAYLLSTFTNKVSKSIICLRMCTYKGCRSKAGAGRWSVHAAEPVPWSRILGAYQRCYLHGSTFFFFPKTKSTAMINSNCQAPLRSSDNPSHCCCVCTGKEDGERKQDGNGKK